MKIQFFLSRILKLCLMVVAFISMILISGCGDRQPNANALKEVYKIGSEIAEAVTRNIVDHLLESDQNLTYSANVLESTHSQDSNTWPILDVTIETRSQIEGDRNIRYFLFLEIGSNSTIIGTIMRISIDGETENSLAVLKETMYVVTEEGVQQVRLIDGKLYPATQNEIVLAKQSENQNNNQSGSTITSEKTAADRTPKQPDLKESFVNETDKRMYMLATQLTANRVTILGLRDTAAGEEYATLKKNHYCGVEYTTFMDPTWSYRYENVRNENTRACSPYFTRGQGCPKAVAEPFVQAYELLLAEKKTKTDAYGSCLIKTDKKFGLVYKR